ncbi:MAG: SDR family NAD(P)-dependent oxidoreductase [Proteobacteria bacterium]|jgi:3-oxoacyl-[acyl-carrier protein] reductase|nr:SDR family NAD(P)-dependent oxidoreductase [Pseudomonadota bacterium]MDA1155309.1 SDR family NAD(P)-dependent oxidoreductase [Pseudomonadota bacterium]
MTTELNGKRALVTGAARGIGAAVAKTLAAAGARVLLCDLKDPAETVAAIRAAGGQAEGMACDVSDVAATDALFVAADQLFDRLDIAVTAAGILIEAKLADMEIAEFDRIVAVNLRGTFLCAKGAARLMQKAGSGRIITISSELAQLGRADFSAYCATKAGVVGLTKSLARELAPGILVNSVAPGPVDTPMLGLENMSPEWREKEFDIPLRRVGTPQEIAALVRFLCGPDAGFFTGQTISPNGGAVMV